jgi:hypothetical protein
MTKKRAAIRNIGSSCTIKQISNKEWEDMQKRAIPQGEWHFERVERGVKPVPGKYDPNNRNHIRVEDVITIEEF